MTINDPKANALTPVQAVLMPSVVIDPQKAHEKLQRLGFDPIQKMVELHENIEADLANLMYDEDGEIRKNYSQVAYAQMMSIKQKVVADLLRFGYARVTEGIEVKNSAIAPINIVLSKKDSEFSLDGMEPIDDAPMKGPNE